MDCIEMFKQAAAAMQKDPRYLALENAPEMNDSDAELQAQIREFNECRAELNDEISRTEDRDDARIMELNETVNRLYGDIMNSEGMLAYNQAKQECETLISYIDAIVNAAVNGRDPMTVEEPVGGCTGSCSTCGGCH